MKVTHMNQMCINLQLKIDPLLYLLLFEWIMNKLQWPAVSGNDRKLYFYPLLVVFKMNCWFFHEFTDKQSLIFLFLRSLCITWVTCLCSECEITATLHISVHNDPYVNPPIPERAQFHSVPHVGGLIISLKCVFHGEREEKSPAAAAAAWL